jgi:hypothetical protein
MKNWFGTFMLSAALLSPLAIPSVARADDDDRDHHTQRYYDSEHHDYHQWNDNERRAYRQWYVDQHRDYRDWDRLNDERRREYWRWRHEHERDFPERTEMPRHTQ